MRLILLHGWGASGNDLEPLGENLLQLLGLNPAVATLRCLEAPDPHPAGAGGAHSQRPEQDDLGRCGRVVLAQCQLHHDADRNAVAVIPMPSRREVWRVYSSGFFRRSSSACV